MTPQFRRISFVAAAIAGTVTVGTLGYIFVAHYPVLDAIYMAVMTMTTVGYGEIRPLSQAARVFNTFYMLLSVSMLLLALGVMTQTIIELQFGNLLVKRRAKKMIDKLENHYIICGFGRVGRGSAAELRQAGVPLVIIDRREDRVDWAMRAGYLACLGDSTRDETLYEVRVTHARGLIAALATDADNLFAVISAKTLNPKIRVAARAAEEEAERKMRQVGADAVFAPYVMTGTRLAQSLLKPHVRQFLDFATTNIGLDVGIEQLEVGAGSDLVGKSLADLRIRSELKVIVLAIRRADGKMVFNPPADAVIQVQDYLIVMGESEPLRRLESRVTGAVS
ncbi:potassium channel family protein [Paludibaculum fermentans]|uniref:potassium channel family protein n=1 Tax=Paludibaculum fermentans TaxID=1473598 RepID=UPI003EB9FA2E